jgi:hypothetical protein
LLLLGTAPRIQAESPPGPSAAQAPLAVPEVDPAVDRRALIASGEAPDLFLLYTGGVMGYLDACG